MQPSRSSLLCAGTVGLLLQLGSLTASVIVPQMPEPQFAPSVKEGVGISDKEIRRQLEETLPPGTKLVFDGLTAPTAEAKSHHATQAKIEDSLPVPVAVSIDRYPVIDFADTTYAPLDHRFVPVLLDWFEALLADFKLTPAEARERGLLSNKVARLMRVFMGTRINQEGRRGILMSPAIGWCRVYFKEDWGRFHRGETHSLIIMATDEGWIAVDPYARRMRKLVQHDTRWIIEFIVI